MFERYLSVSRAGTSVPGFNGQHRDILTGHYLLGNGYRAFNPVLMRFNSPDTLSPFGKGGINAYGYCQGDPVNRKDANGHWGTLLRRLTPARLGYGVVAVGVVGGWVAIGLVGDDRLKLGIGVVTTVVAVAASATFVKGLRPSPRGAAQVGTATQQMDSPVRQSLTQRPPPSYDEVTGGVLPLHGEVTGGVRPSHGDVTDGGLPSYGEAIKRIRRDKQRGAGPRLDETPV